MDMSVPIPATMTTLWSEKLSRSARRPLFVCMVAVLMALTFTNALRAQEYPLGPMDKLRVRVVEWMPASETFRDWSAVSGDYVVGPSGNLSLPFLGETPVLGRTTAEIGVVIAEGLRQKFALPGTPEASVELVEFRPFYILGDVHAAGQFPYSPGLTVIKAIGVAGGFRRAVDVNFRAERDLINARTQLEIAIDERNRLLVRRARLLAEAGGAADFEMPPELSGRPGVEELVVDERAIFVSRKERLRLQLAALDDRRDLLEREIGSIDQKLQAQERQVELAKEELGSIGNLASQGLVVNARVLAIERSIAELEGRVIDLDTASLRAKLEISRADQDEINLRNDRSAEIAADLQRVAGEIEASGRRIDQYRALIAEALTIDPQVGNQAPDVRMTFTISRTYDDAVRDMVAGETTPLLPGDVLKVEMRADGLPGNPSY